MAGFLYYKPSFTGTVTLANVREWGLAYAFTASPNGTVCMNNTPDGRTGSVFADSARLGEWQAIMNMEEQVWRKSADCDWYVGYWNAAPPTPENLERPSMLAGYPITIGGMSWQVPETASFDEENESLVPALPCKLEYAGDGKWSKGDVLEVYKNLWAIGEKFREGFIAHEVRGEPLTVYSDSEIGEAAHWYLQANYVVGPDELSILEILSTGDRQVALAVMLANSYLQIRAWAEQKKTDQSSTPLGSGIADGAAA